MKPAAKKISVELVKADDAGGKIAAVIGTAEAAGAAIAEDCRFVENSARTSALVALRIGLRLALVRDTGVYGCLGKFIKAHVKGQTERTLYRYLRIAGEFVADAKLADRKTQRLTNGDAIAPALTAELMSLADGATGGVIKKMVKWVDGRSVTQIYRDLAEEAPAKTPGGGKRTAEEAADDHTAWAEEAHADAVKLAEFRALGRWKFLEQDKLGALVSELNSFLRELGEFQKAAGTKAKAAKGKGGAR